MSVILDMSYETFLEGVGNDLTNALSRVAPVDTGFLRNAIRYEVKGDKIIISLPIYALYLEYGTGLYGPEHHRIYPKTKKALHWIGKGGGDVFAASTAGMHPQPFIRNTLYHKLPQIIADNAARHLGEGMEASFS